MDGETEESCLTTVGKYERLRDGFVLSYDEVGDFSGSITEISYKGKQVLLNRQGRNVAKLIIEKDKRYNCLYRTEYADLMLGVIGKSINSEASGNEGKLTFSYLLDFNAGYSSSNELTVSYRLE